MASYRKRGNSYLIKASCGYSLDGKQIAPSYTWHPEPDLSPKKLEKELQRRLVEWDEQCKHKLASARRIKFQKFVEEEWAPFFSDIKHAQGTKDNYRDIEKRVFPKIGHLYLDQIDMSVIERFLRDLRKPGANRKTGKPLSVKTVKNYLAYISGVLSYAVTKGLIKENPCRNIAIENEEKKPPKMYTIEEAQKFLDCLMGDDVPVKYRVFFLIDMFSGFRRGEALGLEWPNIDFDHCTVKIKPTSHYSPTVGIYTKDPKTKDSERILKLPSFIFDELRVYRTWQALDRLKKGDQWHETNRLFTQWDGKPMHPNTPYNWLQKFCKRHDLPRVGVHSFRHLNASMLIMAGAKDTDVAAALGHSSPNTTKNIYIHSFQEQQARLSQAAADQLDFISIKKKHS